MSIKPHRIFYVAPTPPGSTKYNTLKIVAEPQVMIDGHMHINSGHCAPIPLLWETIPVLGWLKTRRSIIETAAHVVSARAAETQSKATDQVAVDAIDKNSALYANQTQFPKGPTQDRLTPMVVMPMDMEFAHIDGFKGEHIYKLADGRFYHEWEDEYRRRQRNLMPPDILTEVKYDDRINQYTWRGVLLIKESGDFYWYYDRQSVDLDDRKAVWLHPQEFKMYEKWETQTTKTKLAVLQNPWRLLPMFHYDPRRWIESWKEPFDDVATAAKPGLFIGFKMYTALGYKPMDERLKHMSNYYAQCANEDIPIVCHCSAGGVRSIDRKLYYDLEQDPAKRKKYERRFWFDDKVGYYYDHYVGPMAWRDQVLEKHHNLRLCLAHFGGNDDEWKEWRLYSQVDLEDPVNPQSPPELRKKWYNDQRNGLWIKTIVAMMKAYPNFYTDISFHMLERNKEEFRFLLTIHPSIKDRIIFGTDWYMIQLDSYDYDKYCLEAKETLDELSEDKNINDDLWERFTTINPITFFKLQEIADNYIQGARNAHQAFKKVIPKLKDNLFENGARIIKKVRI